MTDDYLPKPFNARELEVRVINPIEQRKRLQEHFSRKILLEPMGVLVSSADEIFIGKIAAGIEENIASETLGVEFLSHISDSAEFSYIGNQSTDRGVGADAYTVITD